MKLNLVLKKQWYDMIETGEKTEEYREIKDYWRARLVSSFSNYAALMFMPGYKDYSVTFKEFDSVVFKNGYQKDARTMEFKIKDISVAQGKEEWGAKINNWYFVIKLGEKVI